MPRPKWIDEPLNENQTPADVLRQAAKVLEMDAKEFRKHGEYERSRDADHYANVLKRVADGKSWAAAFAL